MKDSPKRPSSPNKQETLDRLSHSVFELEVEKGHLSWKVTDLVRKSKLSRSLIYRYMGGSKRQILGSALDNFVNEFYGFNPNQSDIAFPERIRLARLRMEAHPDAILFYQKWRSKESWLQREFISIEQKFQRKLKKLFPNLTDLQITSLHVVIHGLTTAPFLSAEEASRIFASLTGHLDFGRGLGG